MNDYLIAVILGIVEGLTEFLPVSSTAHIRIAQKWLGLDETSDYWKMFAIVIQLGAILSVVVYFWNKLLGLVVDFWLRATGKSNVTEKRPKPLWLHPLAIVFLAFVITAIPCFLIDKVIGEHLENLPMMAWALIIGGIVMLVIDRWFSPRATTSSLDDISLKQATMVGLAQIIAAAFPGTSRSMATIAGGQIVGLSRSTALEFSFFLSIPVMVAATSFKLLQFLLKSSVAFTTENAIVLAIGFVVSFAVALAVIAWFMHWVRRQGFLPFAIYRVVAGILVLIWVAKQA